jgi:hypothetical protein
MDTDHDGLAELFGIFHERLNKMNEVDAAVTIVGLHRHLRNK